MTEKLRFFEVISAVSIYRIITCSTVRSIWQSTYSSVSRAWEAEITFSVSPEGETRPLCSPPAALQGSFQVLYLSSNWWLNVPSTLQRFPEGNSKLYFKNWDWCPAAYLFPSCFLGIYFIWFCWGDIILGSFGLVFRIQCPWSDPRVMCAGWCLLKDLQMAL